MTSDTVDLYGAHTVLRAILGIPLSGHVPLPTARGRETIPPVVLRSDHRTPDMHIRQAVFFCHWFLSAHLLSPLSMSSSILIPIFLNVSITRARALFSQGCIST